MKFIEIDVEGSSNNVKIVINTANISHISVNEGRSRLKHKVVMTNGNKFFVSEENYQEIIKN